MDPVEISLVLSGFAAPPLVIVCPLTSTDAINEVACGRGLC